MSDNDEGQVVATIGGEMPVGGLDGAGSGFGLSSCPTCHRFIDTICSVCPSPEAVHLTREEAVERHEELHAQNQRERDWYKRGAR